MNKVESKYKNPDEYIRRLKAQVDEAWACAGRSHEEMGCLVFEYDEESVLSINTDDSQLGVFRVGDMVVIRATVKKITEEKDESEIQYGDITVRRKESQ